jgi:anthranilate/para-aminobenzoate synthase component I
MTIRCIPLAEWWDPAYVFETLYRDSSHAFWLDAGVGAEQGLSYLGAATRRSRLVTASVADNTVTVSLPLDATVPAVTCEQTIFEYLGDDLARSTIEAVVPGAVATVVPGAGTPMVAPMPTSTPGAGPGFRLGWVGWFGYELGAQTTGTAVHPSRYPDAALLHVDRAIAFDHATRTVTLLVLDGAADTAGDDSGAWAASVEEDLRAGPRAPLHPTAPTATPASPATPGHPASTVTWRHSAAHYADLIRRCQQAIRRGDAYQLCLTNEIAVDAHPDPLDAYLVVREGSPSHHGGLLRFAGIALLSASPEQFLTITPGGRISTKPIKGTRPRSPDRARDDLLRRELLASEKERAENLMIVDLMRNDLGRIAVPGSVTVTGLLEVESYRHVHQLVSTIVADLLPGVSAVDAIAACFPAGSMTGAPKVSAMTILHGLENGPRGIYSGAFGYLGLDGAVDLAMVIRSIVLGPSGAYIGTGGGITALSDPQEEVEETRIKAAALLAVLASTAGISVTGKL